MNVLLLCNLSFLKFIFPKLGIDQSPDAIAFTSRLDLSLVHYERFHDSFQVFMSDNMASFNDIDATLRIKGMK